MATKNIVPRANGEGAIGDNTQGSEKYWNAGYFLNLNGTDAVEMAKFNADLQWKANTIFAKGDIVFTSGLKAGLYLECTTNGTSGATKFTIPASVVPDSTTIADNTVIWTVRKIGSGSGGGAGIEIGDVTNASITAGHARVMLTWTDPENLVIEGATLAKWAGTLVVRKEGSAPTSKNDGTLVIDSTSKNAYASTPFVDNGLTDGVTYYYRFFPYTTGSTYTTGTVLDATPDRTAVAIPTTDSQLTYDGTYQTPVFTNYDSTKMTKSGDEGATNAGDYATVFTLGDDYKWSDNTLAPKSVAWSIAKAAGSITLSKDSISLDTTTTSDTVTVSRLGDGAISVESSDTSVVTVSLSGDTITVTEVDEGSATITVSVAEGTNYLATSQTISAVVQFARTMTVHIDLSDSNPDTCCTYADDAIGMTPGSDDWDEFFGHYPVMFKNGVEGKKLQSTDFTKHEDGTSADITSGSEGDVMIAFPRRGLKMSKSGNIITISMTNILDDTSFEFMAHKRGSTLKDKFYLGAYKGSEVSSKLRSLSGKTCANNKTIGAFRTLAQANGAPNGSGGSGYDQSGWYQLIYRQCMYILKYKSLNSQSKIGRGFVDGNSAQKSTGGTETKGMDWGETTGKDHMKLFGLEDSWGNVYEWIDGYFFDSKRNIKTATENFNDTGSNYTARGVSGYANVSSGYMNNCVGDTHSGFTPTSTSGSETTYFCDKSSLNVSRLPVFGGAWNNPFSAGAFFLSVYYSVSDIYPSFGARLMYV